MTWKSRTGYVLAWGAVGAAVWLYVDRREVLARYQAFQESTSRVQSEAEKTAELSGELTRIEERVENLHTNPLELESAIRRAKGLVRPGEIVYRITEDRSAAPQSESGSDTPPTSSGEQATRPGALEAITPVDQD